MNRTATALVLTVAFAMCPSVAYLRQSEPDANTLTAKERADRWRLLFDGKTTTGWRGYRLDAPPDGWNAIDGALTRVGRGGDIITVDEFEDFELAIDWKLLPGGNSGIFYRVVEGDPVMWKMAPEYQLLDETAHPTITSEQVTGANYALHAPKRGVAPKPPGAWNQARVLAKGAHVEHWLNGAKVVDYALWSEDWERRVHASKFKDCPEYGRARKGHIGLQDHGDHVAFRNIKIRVVR